MNAIDWNRFQFGFTIVFHYLFPQLTMGLAFIIVVLKILALRTKDSRYNDAARFWGRIFGINFAVGVVTGIPMEFQFGTNWARFSSFSGGVIGTTLAMEGMFAFFAESAFFGIFLYGEKRLSQKLHLVSAVMLLLSSWLSGYFIIATDAFMQHPVGYTVGKDGLLYLQSFWTFVLNPWAFWQYAHNMTATVVTSSFVVMAVGAFYLLDKKHVEYARIFMKVGVVLGLIFSLIQVFPTGYVQAKMVAVYQPAALAALEGQFHTSSNADMTLMGQPDVSNGTVENPISLPGALSFLAYGSTGANVKGLDAFPKDQQPDNVDMVYYAYHIMVDLGIIFILLTLAGVLMLKSGKLFSSKIMLSAFMLAFPFPYIATIMGWMSAEMGRQPWLVYGLLRTVNGTSPTVSGGYVAFTTLGFMGLYMVIGLIFLYLVMREVGVGPVPLENVSTSLYGDGSPLTPDDTSSEGK